jgi:hypothetical protein
VPLTVSLVLIAESNRTMLMKITGVAATILAQRLGPGHRIVTILCDSGMFCD